MQQESMKNPILSSLESKVIKQVSTSNEEEEIDQLQHVMKMWSYEKDHWSSELTKASKARLNLGLVLQSGDDLTLIHVELEAPLYQVLDLHPPITMTPVDGNKTTQYQDAAKELYKGLKVMYTQILH